MKEITLPYPPAVNNLFATVGRRRIRSRRYEDWCEIAGLMLASQRPAKIKGPFTIRIIAERPDKRSRDLDNILKAPLDLLVTMGVIEDDSLAQEIVVGWSPKAPALPGRLVITVEAVQAPQPVALAA